MKFEGWTTEPRWEWEKIRNVLVFAEDDTVSTLTGKVIMYIQELLGEFRIPLHLSIGNLEGSKDLELVKEMLCQSLTDNKIDYPKFEEKLGNARKIGRLPYGLVLLVDKVKYEFYKRPEQPNRAIYGVGDCNGYVILRCTHRESVRHEFAHMLCLHHHCPPKEGCIMNWACAIPAFCDDCKQRIAKMWQAEIEGREMR